MSTPPSSSSTPLENARRAATPALVPPHLAAAVSARVGAVQSAPERRFFFPHDLFFACAPRALVRSLVGPQDAGSDGGRVRLAPAAAWRASAAASAWLARKNSARAVPARLPPGCTWLRIGGHLAAKRERLPAGLCAFFSRSRCLPARSPWLTALAPQRTCSRFR